MKKLLWLPFWSVFLLAIVASLSTTSCSAQNLGVGLSIGVTPGSSVIVPVGNVSSCLDYLNFREATSAATLSQSVSSPSISFTNFSLNWTSTTEKLYVKAIRFIIQGSGIQGGKVSTYMATDEISAMLKTPVITGTPPAVTISGYTGYNGEIDNPFDIETNSAVKTTPVGVVPVTPDSVACGFTMGGIGLTAGDKTASFTAEVEIEVIGVAIDNGSQNQRIVIQTTTATAQYIGIDQ